VSAGSKVRHGRESAHPNNTAGGHNTAGRGARRKGAQHRGGHQHTRGPIPSANNMSEHPHPHTLPSKSCRRSPNALNQSIKIAHKATHGQGECIYIGLTRKHPPCIQGQALAGDDRAADGAQGGTPARRLSGARQAATTSRPR